MITRRTAILTLATLPLARPAWAATPPVFATDGVAIHGADPVAYFTQGRPVDGDAGITSTWNGAVFRFASTGHKAMFDADPERHAPRYGGYCAYALSKGAIATTVPEAWTVHDDRLYLNYSTGVRQLWQQDIPGNIARADGYWPDILNA